MAGAWQPVEGREGADGRGREGEGTTLSGRVEGPLGGGEREGVQEGAGRRRSLRAHAVGDTQRSAGAQVRRRAEQEQRRVRMRQSEAEGRAGRRTEEREKGRARVARRIIEMARAGGWTLL